MRTVLLTLLFCLWFGLLLLTLGGKTQSKTLYADSSINSLLLRLAEIGQIADAKHNENFRDMLLAKAESARTTKEQATLDSLLRSIDPPAPTASQIKSQGLQVYRMLRTRNGELEIVRILCRPGGGSGIRYISHSGVPIRPVFAVVTGLLVLLTGVPLVRRVMRRKPGHCAKCGYCLTGNVTGVCPECGARVGPEAAAALPGQVD